MQRSFRSLIKNRKERKDLSILYKRMGKNAKIVPFFLKNGKERKDRSVLLKRMFAQPWYFAEDRGQFGSHDTVGTVLCLVDGTEGGAKKMGW